MKKRLLAIILTLSCLLTLVGASSVWAEEPVSTEIKGHNLALMDAVNIIYYADFQNVPVGAETGVLVWTNPQSSYVYGTEEAKLESVGKDYGYEKFIFTGVAAKMMTQDIYAVSYIKNGAEITYSEIDKYSVLQYAYNKKGDTTMIGGTKTLSELLTDLLNYGTTAQEYFNYKTDRLANADYYQIKVVNGTLPDGTTKGLYQAGESVTLNATVENFDHWENAVGDTVANPITVVGADIYTAVAIRYSKGLAFTSNGDGTCCVSGIGTCTDTDIVIPPTSPAGDSVTCIHNYAFDRCMSISSITIPNSVTSIGYEAFYYCMSLTSITIPNSVLGIGQNALYSCQLTSITYTGTRAQWRAIHKGKAWDAFTGNYTVHCTDGDIAK